MVRLASLPHLLGGSTDSFMVESMNKTIYSIFWELVVLRTKKKCKNLEIIELLLSG